jgi:hypothetical protein
MHNYSLRRDYYPDDCRASALLRVSTPQNTSDSAGQRAAAKDGELDRHYETEFH